MLLVGYGLTGFPFVVARRAPHGDAPRIGKGAQRRHGGKETRPSVGPSGPSGASRGWPAIWDQGAPHRAAPRSCPKGRLAPSNRVHLLRSCSKTALRRAVSEHNCANAEGASRGVPGREIRSHTSRHRPNLSTRRFGNSLRSTTITIGNAIFTAAKPSSSTAPLPWLSGGNSQPEGGGITIFGHQFA